MIVLLYYIFVWPFVAIGGALVDDVLVRLGFKYYPPTGPRAAEGENGAAVKLVDERQHHQAVRDLLAKAFVGQYLDYVRMWWSAWLLLWRAIGMEAGR